MRISALSALLALAAASAAPADQTPAPADASVYIIAPKDGARVHSPVTVVFGLAGLGIAPAGVQFDGTGHHHLLIDTDLPADLSQPLPVTDHIRHFGKGQTQATLDLAPGRHTLQLLFADYRHIPFNPDVASKKITITVIR